MKRRRRAAAGGEKDAALRAGVHDAAEHARTERAKNIAAVLWMAWPLAAFLVLAAAANPDDFDPTATRFGLNWPGDLPRTLVTVAVETVVLVLLLRPWSFRDSAWRLVLALALFVPWTVFSFMTTMHGGTIIHTHGFWLLVVCVGLVNGLVNVAAARRNQPPSSAQPTAGMEE